MRCPWCDFAAAPTALHAHLGERHAGEVAVAERNGKVFYQVTCPECGARYEHLVRKAARDPEFAAEFGREIALVALDMLVHHLLAEHDQQDPASSVAPPEPVSLSAPPEPASPSAPPEPASSAPPEPASSAPPEPQEDRSLTR